MNKKFSTLAASLLLASAFVGTAQAIDLGTAKTGQYYQLCETYYYPLSGNWAADPNANLFISDNGTNVVLSTKNDASSYWMIEKRVNASGDTEARLVNAKTGKALKLNKTEWFRVSYTDGSYKNILYLGSAADRTQLGYDWDGTTQTGTLKFDAAANYDGTSSFALAFDATPVAATEYSATELNKKLGSSFGLRIGFLNDDEEFEDYTLQGAEAFQGNLVAKDDEIWSGATGIAAAPAENTVHIWNAAAKKYVVLTKNAWGSLIDADGSTTNAPKGYKFALMSASEIKADLAKADDKQSILTATFKITGEANKDGRLEVAAVDAYSGYDAELYVYKNDGKYYLTVNKAVKNADETLGDGDADKVASYMTSTWVKFGLANYMNVSDFYGYAVTIKGLKGTNKGKTLCPLGNEWLNTEYVAMTKPEGQWIVTTDAAGVVEWTNRETGETTTKFKGMRKVDGDTYTVEGTDKDLYEIKATDKLGGDTYEYYGEYEANDAAYGEPHTYKIKFKNATSVLEEYVSVNGKGELILTNNKNAAIVFDLHKTWMTNDMKANGKVNPNVLVDRFHIVNNAMLKNKKGEWEFVENADTVSFHRYYFRYGEKYLQYNGNDRLTLSSTPDAFVIKEKDGDAVNIINVDGTDYDKSGNDAFYDLDAWPDGRYLLTSYDKDGDGTYDLYDDVKDAQMLYFDENKAILRQDYDIYDWNANAQLTIDDKDEIAYRTVALAPDTLEFFRTEYSDEFLFEHGDFLGMTYNREKYNPAILVDTAWVRYDTKKPYYFLAVGAEKTDATMKCPIDGKADCDHAVEIPGMISGRYLVSLTDSVAAHAALLNNPFCYTGTKMTKLGFVPAVHCVDTLFIMQNGKAVDKYTIDGTGVSPVGFAFRIINEDTQDFVIETGRLRNEKAPYSPSTNWYEVAYVKWHNGCPVLTNDIAEAEVFNVRETSANPTANEAIEAAEVVVIAGKGVVTVQGAAGKVVTVANILGQTIANQVAASDNVTIAAPAGVLVVTVDGEATKVVVK